MATHRTVRTFNKSRTRCTIEHSMKFERGQGTMDSDKWSRVEERANTHHQAIVEAARPDGDGWELQSSGGSGGHVDSRGYEVTYWSKWTRSA